MYNLPKNVLCLGNKAPYEIKKGSHFYYKGRKYTVESVQPSGFIKAKYKDKRNIWHSRTRIPCGECLFPKNEIKSSTASIGDIASAKTKYV